MDKKEALKIFIKNKNYLNKIKSFIILTKIDEYNPDNKEEGTFYKIDNKYYIFTKNNLEEIESNDNPLFSIYEKITIDYTWLNSVKDKVETTIGRLFSNLILLYTPFKDKINYLNEQFDINSIEDFIAQHLVEDDKVDNTNISISELNKFVDCVSYFKSFGPIGIISVTPKSITEPEGIEEYRKKLKEKYGNIKDWTQLTNFENELKEYDKNYLKDDPTYGKFTKGKILNISRKKLYLTFGAESGFDHTKPPHVIDKSLSEGWSEKPEDLVSMFNNSRSGSFSRGALTQQGGTVAKIILRVTNSIFIKEDDCGTNEYYEEYLDSYKIKFFMHRYILSGNTLVELTESNKDKFLNKKVKIRSPLYCKTKNNNFCKICLGSILSKNKDSIPLATTEVSGIILNSSMKAMHGTVLEKEKIDLEDLIT